MKTYNGKLFLGESDVLAKSMTCPKCIGRLETIDIGGLEIDKCFICNGLWFDAGELEKALSLNIKKTCKAKFDDKSLDGVWMKDAIALNAKNGFCPVCVDEFMHKSVEEQSGITIDYCKKGHGIWLDGGELWHMRNNRKSIVLNILGFFKHIFSLNILKR